MKKETILSPEDILESKNLETLQRNLNQNTNYYMKHEQYNMFDHLIHNLPVFSNTLPKLNHRFYFSYDNQFILMLYKNTYSKDLKWIRLYRPEVKPESSLEKQIQNGFFKYKFIMYNGKYPPQSGDTIKIKDTTPIL